MIKHNSLGLNMLTFIRLGIQKLHLLIIRKDGFQLQWQNVILLEKYREMQVILRLKQLSIPLLRHTTKR